MEKLFLKLEGYINNINLIVAIASGIWLAIKGEWTLIGLGIILFFISDFIISLLMTVVFISVIADRIKNSKKVLSDVLNYISATYIGFIIALTYVVFQTISFRIYGGESNIESLPYFLWAWSIAFVFWTPPEPNELIIIFRGNTSIFFLLIFISMLININIAAVIVIVFIVIQFIYLPIKVFKMN